MQLEAVATRKRRSKKKGSSSILGSLFFYAFRILLYFPLSLIVEPFRMLLDLFRSLRAREQISKTFSFALIWMAILGGVGLYLHQHSGQPWWSFGVAMLLPRLWSWLFRPALGLTAPPPSGDEFYRSRKWRELRYDVLRERGAVCELCGSQEPPLHVDHIRPRSKYPHLALDHRNLQVLCADCNVGKGVRHEDDFRAS